MTSRGVAGQAGGLRSNPYENLRSLIKLTCLLATVTLAAAAFAVTPAPDGGYSGLNTAEGEDALFSLTAGMYNTAIGFNALNLNTDGNQNTAIGAYALSFRNTTGSLNTAVGYVALFNNENGDSNTAIGSQALVSNRGGGFNTATGANALVLNISGGSNTAAGVGALQFNSTGSFNTANGGGALGGNSTGNNNTAIGSDALRNNTTGSFNTAVGDSAGVNLTTGSNNIDFGNAGVAGEAGTIRVGTAGTQTKTFIAAIRGVVLAGGQPVVVNASGQLGVKGSSARFKEAIKSMDKASEAILSLRPVSFRYRKELDVRNEPQFGLIAEEVAKVAPDLVVKDELGKPFSVRYEEVNAMLLNEFLKEHRKVEEQSAKMAKQDCKVEALETTVAQLKSTVAQQKDLQANVVQLQSALKEQAAQIQKVSDQLAASKAAPPMLVQSY